MLRFGTGPCLGQTGYQPSGYLYPGPYTDAFRRACGVDGGVLPCSIAWHTQSHPRWQDRLVKRSLWIYHMGDEGYGIPTSRQLPRRTVWKEQPAQPRVTCVTVCRLLSDSGRSSHVTRLRSVPSSVYTMHDAVPVDATLTYRSCSSRST